MAFDSNTRNRLARMVAEARQLLTDEFTQQFQEIYGIQPDGTITEVEKLTHLDDQQASTAKLLRERIDHLASGMTSEKKPIVAAIDRTIREQAFTILNRFAALRMCEERSFVEECIREGMPSKGFKVYETVASSGLGDTHERYKTFLFCLFDEIAIDLGVLFDRFSPYGLLFPRGQALLELFTIINNGDLTEIWAEDETIGWIYQYFNSKEEREAMRKASAAPRNSRELAVRNQFFTPRYVVEFLADNTLGCIWYEMRKGDTSLKEECHYLVRRPNELFLRPGQKAPPQEDAGGDLSQEELLRRPVYIEHRPKKDPRDIRILDPACGSGHFLLYAFDLLEMVYEEAWEDPESPKSEPTGGTLREDYETIYDLRCAVPELILRWNLHGIDIDPRAVQIASLALWLRTHKAWKRLGLRPAERPCVTRSNIVTAESMPGEEDMRRVFIDGFRPKVLGQLVDVVFEKMKLAGEAGSLLKIEEEIKDAVAEAKKQWLEGPKAEQQPLFPGMAAPRSKQQEIRFDLKGITEERFWERVDDRILAALKDYAERVENGHAIRRRLFAEDAARGFAFIDLCRKRYDVVLMNPPFGLAPRVVFAIHKKLYADSYVELYAQMVTRGSELLNKDGCLGAISSRSFMTISRLRQYRRKTVLPGVALLADLGASVMDDAFVESAAYVISKRSDTNILALDLRRTVEPQPKLSESIIALEDSNRTTN